MISQKIPGEYVRRYFSYIPNTMAFLIMIIFLAAGCGPMPDSLQASEVILSDTDVEAQKVNFDVFAWLDGGSIRVAEKDRQNTLNVIGIEHGESGVFLDMLDEENGFLLYCGGPAAGQMTKILYSTSDRWNTYDQLDISSAIDGYPTSLCVLSEEHFYIGTQMRSKGYLFETTDSGERWENVQVDNDIKNCRYGYVPLFDVPDGKAYVLLECEGTYYLYSADARQRKWNKIGSFEFETPISAFFVLNNALYISDTNENTHQIMFD